MMRFVKEVFAGLDLVGELDPAKPGYMAMYGRVDDARCW
jgi:hypothetical protein